MKTAGPDHLPPTSGGGGIVTTCGRRIAVRRLRLASAERPIDRIALDVGPDRGGEPGTWAALTAGEARDLADLLLRHAGLAERGAGPVGPAREASSAS
ncbi:hypothetical protein [Streptomyces marokkonensis]|uniref:hypothetical protein n=1 Tax=Streptomyces marokkonensis TaxID=324855 RepID=UPI001FCBA30A|nr:hypothetical protein [Streptomyces marokkonensis]